LIRLLAEFILSRLLAYWSAIRLVLKATVLPVNLKYIDEEYIRTPSVSELTRLALELILSTRHPSPAVDNLVNQGKIRKAPEGLAVPPRDSVGGPTLPKPPSLKV
jgi:hypothetical protein